MREPKALRKPPPVTHFYAAGHRPSCLSVIQARCERLSLPEADLERPIARDAGAADLTQTLVVKGPHCPCFLHPGSH